MSSPIHSNIQRTVRAFLDGYNDWDIDAIMAQMADDCVFIMLPKSLGVPGRNKREYREYLDGIMPLFKNFKLHIHDIVYDADQRKAALHLSSNAETSIGSYDNEYTFIFTFSADGKALTKVQEMVDSSYAEQFFRKLARHIKRGGKL